MPGYEIVDGTISEAVGSASSATIKLPPSNIMRDVPIKRASVISIRKDGAEVFRGSVVTRLRTCAACALIASTVP